MVREVVAWRFYGFSLQKLRHLLNEEIAIDGIGVIPVDLASIFEAEMVERLVIVVDLQQRRVEFQREGVR